VIGGTAVVDDAVAAEATASSRVAGSDRYDTSVRVAERFFPDAQQLAIASGVTFADALTGGPPAAKAATPVVLAAPIPSPVTYAYVRGRLRALNGSVVYGTNQNLPSASVTLLFS
jgi:hypothetical protein